MLKRKENKNSSKGRKSQLIIVGSLLILIGTAVVGGKYLYNYLLDKAEDRDCIKDYFVTKLNGNRVNVSLISLFFFSVNLFI